jgi:zinc transport system substrate-binding protein
VPAAFLSAQEVAPLTKIKIVTTIFPLYDFAREVGGRFVEVSLVLPPGVEPHAFEPTPGDISRINEADIFIFSSRVMEPWVQRLLPGITNQNLQIIDASRGDQLLARWKVSELGETWEQGNKDPHFWLDFSIDMMVVDSIAEALIERDSAHKKDYLTNAEAYKAKLTALDQSYRVGLKDCATQTIVLGGHVAFGYLTRRYGLQSTSPYTGFSPNAEPSPKAVADVITAMKETGANRVYYEELVTPKVANVIADETGAKATLLHAAHNVSADELAGGVTFISIMEDNLKKLREGLQCQ